MLKGAIFSNFTRDERKRIWGEVLGFKGLVPSVYAFFVNYKYVKAYVNYIKRLTGPYLGETVFTVLERVFSNTNLGIDHTVV